MAQKRKAKEAFSTSKELQLSAFAAARKLKQNQEATDPAGTNKSSPASKKIHTENQSTFPEIQKHSEVAVGAATLSSSDAPTTHTAGVRGVIRDDESCLEFSLTVNEKVTLTGEYGVTVVKGVVEINGATLTPKTGIQRIFAPSTHALPQIIGRTEQCVVRVDSVGSQLRKLENCSSLFRNIWNGDENKNRSFAISDVDVTDQATIHQLEINNDIRKALARLNGKVDLEFQYGRAVRIMAVGPKSSGKSTFNRLLCNSILTRPASSKCAFLDLDPGQPEFGPPGQISLIELSGPLFGPPFSHVATANSSAYRLVRSHTLAATSFKDYPDHYLACAVDLIRHTGRTSPIVVNSCGWVSGVGASVLKELATCLQITDVIVLGSVDDSLTTALGQQVDHVQHISRHQTRPAVRSPVELRAMQTMSYFHHRYHIASLESRWLSCSISTFRPWVVAYAGLEAGIKAVHSYSHTVHPDFLGEVLDGSIVAVVAIPKGDDEPTTNVARTTVEDIPYVVEPPGRAGFLEPLNPRVSHCVGLALIRAIDVVHKVFHLVTPLPEKQIAELMDQQILLVRGGFDCPEWAYLEDTSSMLTRSRISFRDDGDAKQTPWVSFREPVGIEGAVWRLRHPPTAASLK